MYCLAGQETVVKEGELKSLELLQDPLKGKPDFISQMFKCPLEIRHY